MHIMELNIHQAQTPEMIAVREWLWDAYTTQKVIIWGGLPYKVSNLEAHTQEGGDVPVMVVELTFAPDARAVGE